MQMWINCRPLICLLHNIGKSILPVIVGLSVTFSTIAKCYVLCYKKSMLEINDAKVSKYAIGTIVLLSVFTNVLKFMIETKPSAQQVSNILLCVNKLSFKI